MRSPTPAILALALAGGLALAAGALAQGVADLALHWTRGDFRAPMLCDVEGQPRRVLRRVRVVFMKRETHRPTNRMLFYDLDAPAETHCFDDEGAEEPNVVGALRFIHEGRRDRPDLAQHDFQDTIRRRGGFTYAIVSGQLRVGQPGLDPEGYETVDFAGGQLEVRAVERGHDSYRRLAEFGPRKKLRLSLEAPDGMVLHLEVVQVDGP